MLMKSLKDGEKNGFEPEQGVWILLLPQSHTLMRLDPGKFK